jgi:hypothetical protein
VLDSIQAYPNTNVIERSEAYSGNKRELKILYTAKSI